MQPVHRPTQPDREPPCATPMPVPAPTGRVRSLPPATRPAIPEPSEAVVRALGAGVRSIRYLHPDNGPSRRVEDWRPPAISDVAVLAQIEAHLAALDQAFAVPRRPPVNARARVALALPFRAQSGCGRDHGGGGLGRGPEGIPHLGDRRSGAVVAAEPAIPAADLRDQEALRGCGRRRATGAGPPPGDPRAQRAGAQPARGADGRVGERDIPARAVT